MGTQAEKIVLTDRAIKALQPAPPGKRVVVWDSVVPHLAIRITDKGSRSFVVRKRMAGQKNPVENVLGTYPALSLVDARKRARDLLGRIAEGVDPKRAERQQHEAETAKAKNNFEAVAKAFIKGHASKNRSGDESQRVINLYLVPTFGAKRIEDIKRREIAELLDTIESKAFEAKDGRKIGGPVMADHVLAALRKLMNWHAARDDDFVSPIVKGMARTKPKERARDRALNDDEIRALWVALDTDATPATDKRMTPDVWAGLVRELLLSAQRREEVGQMRRSEIDREGVWTIPAERYKTGKANIVPLSGAALAIVKAQPRVDGADLVFTTNGKTPFAGYSKSKERLDAAMLAHLRAAHGVKATLPAWTLHDLRRTAKTLMGRAGVRPDISERVLGHVIPGVEGVYDRHSYVAEKRDALEKLAALVAQIVAS